MATLNEVNVLLRVAHIHTQGLIPAIGDRDKMRIDSFPKTGNKIRQRIAKILILATSETMALHHDPAAEHVVFRIQHGQSWHSSGERKSSITALPCASRSCDTRSQSNVLTRAAALFDEAMGITVFAIALMLLPPVQSCPTTDLAAPLELSVVDVIFSTPQKASVKPSNEEPRSKLRSIMSSSK